MLLQTDRPAPGPATTVWRAKRLVQVQVHAVEAMITGAGGPDHRIHVRTIAEHLTADLVQHATDLFDIGFKQSQCRWIRQHERRNFGAVFSEFSLKRGEVRIPFGVRRNGFNAVAAARSGGGVGAMSRVRDQHDVAVALTTRLVVRLDQHEAGHFAMGTGHGLEGDVFEARNSGQHLLDAHEYLQRSRKGFHRLHRMDVGKAWQPGRLLVDFGVVLHRTGAERIEAGLNPVIDVTQIGEVSEKVKFPDLWQVQIFSCFTQDGAKIDFRGVTNRNVASDATRIGLLKNGLGGGNGFTRHPLEPSPILPVSLTKVRIGIPMETIYNSSASIWPATKPVEVY